MPQGKDADRQRRQETANRWLGRAWVLYFLGIAALAVISTWRYYAM